MSKRASIMLIMNFQGGTPKCFSKHLNSKLPYESNDFRKLHQQNFASGSEKTGKFNKADSDGGNCIRCLSLINHSIDL